MNIRQEPKRPAWVRPWNREKFDYISYKDDRFISVVIKGALSWLTRNVVLYNKPIKHFVFNTGSSVMYVETNGYNMSWSETTGEDAVYMSKPRCVVETGDIEIDAAELSQPHVRGVYERECVYKDENGNESPRTEGFNAEMRRVPVTIGLTLRYALSSFNESIVLIEEIMSKFMFQQYYNVIYLGQTIMCSIELPQSFKIDTSAVDLASAESGQKTITLQVSVRCNYPRINEATEMSNSDIIRNYAAESELYYNEIGNTSDKLPGIQSTDDDDRRSENDIRNTPRIKTDY